MSASIQLDAQRNAYVIYGAVDDARFRLIVPLEFIDEELGGNPTPQARQDWIAANMADIVTAYTARTDGGWVKAPWNRILVEEVN